MTKKEKLLYHQIHPLKLAVDISTSITSSYFAWENNFPGFLLLSVPPSLITTYLLIRYANLEKLKDSAIGKYLEKYMTREIELFRGAGQIIIWVAAWLHLPYLIIAGIMIIITSWLNGKIFK